MLGQGDRGHSEDRRRGWRGREDRAEGSWRGHGDGGNFEPSRGRWDDDRRYTRSRQDQFVEDRYALAQRVSGVPEVTNQLRVSRLDQDRAGGREHQASGETSTSGNKPKSGSRLP